VNRFAGLKQREAEGRPISVGLIGAGVFGAMYAAQARRTPGVQLAAVADLDPARAAERLRSAGYDELPPIAEELELDGLEVVVEATGSPLAGARHARAAIAAGCHVVMVNVEADVLCGPELAAEAAQAGVVYSLAYGDQPALICELVDWARTAGFDVVAAGKGTKYEPGFHEVTPDGVWEHYGLTPEAVEAGGLNAQMFTSFLDGTKSAIEMAAVANATGLAVPDGLGFPSAEAAELPTALRDAGGAVEVVASDDLRWGVFVVFAAGDAYVAARFADYGLATDESGRFAALYRPYHLIGLELGISVASAALDGEPTGAPRERRAEVVAVAKRDLAEGEELDGEGGYAVWGRLAPAGATGGLPIGRARGVRLKAPVAAGDVVHDQGVT
jgi:predicted homoserine dehydrogenase-like protein